MLHKPWPNPQGGHWRGALGPVRAPVRAARLFIQQ